MANTNIIELNGKRYDAVSGKLLVKNSQTKPNALVGIVHAHSSGTTDGFIQSNQQPLHPSDIKKAVQVESPRVPQSSKVRVAKRHAHIVVAHKPEPAKTLMRTSVKKPVKTTRAINHIQTAVKETPLYTPKNLLSIPQLNENRLARAKSTRKSAAVSRFDTANRALFVKYAQHLPVKTPPANQQRFNASVKDSTIKTVLAHTASHAQKAPAKHRSRSHIAHSLHLKSQKVNLLAAGLAFILVVGFFAYQNVPNINVRIAAARAGVPATMPGFKPSGFAINGPVKYTQGEVSISFHSNSDQRNFSIVQKTSNWDSLTLLDNFVASTNQEYQTLQDSGRTVYIYGKSNATWVNNGVWYQIVGDSNLNNNQLLQIVASM